MNCAPDPVPPYLFRKRRKLLDHLFHVSIECLRDWMRIRLDLPEGQLAAVAAVQTFGDYLNFHPHLHVLAASGLVDREGRFHLMPVESVEPLAELFRHRFIETLLRKRLISEKKARQLLAWTHSGFSLDAGEKPVSSHDVEGRRRLSEYLLRAPFSLEKITWNETTRKVIYRSKRSWHTKKNFQIFEATDFLAAAVEHIPPKGQQTVRYYGLYSNKRRGMDARARRPRPTMREASTSNNRSSGDPTLFALPPPAPKSARSLRPLWRDLILKIWGEDPMICPSCKGTMKTAGTMIRREEVQFFLRLRGLWEGIIALPPPPQPPFGSGVRLQVTVVICAPLDDSQPAFPPSSSIFSSIARLLSVRRYFCKRLLGLLGMVISISLAVIGRLTCL